MITIRPSWIGTAIALLIGLASCLPDHFDHESYKQCSRRERPLYDHNNGRPPHCD